MTDIFGHKVDIHNSRGKCIVLLRFPGCLNFESRHPPLLTKQLINVDVKLRAFLSLYH